MGAPLLRRLLSFEQLYSPTLIVGMKLTCNDIEVEMAVCGNRCINLDAGYLDHNKYLLASAKEAGQKVYLDNGIYATTGGQNTFSDKVDLRAMAQACGYTSSFSISLETEIVSVLEKCRSVAGPHFVLVKLDRQEIEGTMIIPYHPTDMKTKFIDRLRDW